MARLIWLLVTLWVAGVAYKSGRGATGDLTLALRHERQRADAATEALEARDRTVAAFHDALHACIDTLHPHP